MEKSKLNAGIERMREFVRGSNTIVCAYLFGSAASGKSGKLSDVDIGLYLKSSKPKISRKELEIISKTSSFFKGKTDIVIMNNSKNLLNFNIIKGKLIASNDENVRVMFETKVMSEYLDRKYHEDLQA